jgi:hypothetical protein
VQSSFKIRGYDVFLSALVAQALESGAGVKTRFSLKSYH